MSVYANVDMIVRRNLLEKGLPIHYYLEQLTHITGGLRELTKDTLRVINAANLPLNDYNAVDLPSDFDDDVALCIPAGGFLQEIPKSINLNPLRLHSSSTGAFIPYTSNTNTASPENSLFLGFPLVWSWFWNISSYGEPTGRFFGAQGGARLNTYQVFKERNQIQLPPSFTSQNVILLYIGNGQSMDNATQIDWKAFRCLQTYADWMSSPYREDKDSPPARTFYNENRLLKDVLDPITKTDIVNIYRNAYRGSIKS